MAHFRENADSNTKPHTNLTPFSPQASYHPHPTPAREQGVAVEAVPAVEKAERGVRILPRERILCGCGVNERPKHQRCVGMTHSSYPESDTGNDGDTDND